MLYHHVLAAYDGSEVSLKALRQAVRLADAPGCKLTVAHVLYRPTYAVEGLGFVMPESVQEKVKEYEDGLIRKAQEEIANLPYSEISVLTGPPATAILEHAADQNCDLIVMGSRGLGPFKEMMLGSVSHHVVQQAKCPVLIVK
ncbi:universal stress protein [Cohnella caldifontis]|uniref:universal stress protein n=1 Tax=Cohnella caldifontis TaxID=3027471 RepID=UPI0023ECE008|nr:universal stress protein [Cohnella sp. YIM B05605]